MPRPSIRLLLALAALTLAAPAGAVAADPASQPRIVNGVDAGGYVPWQVALAPMRDGQPVADDEGRLVVFCGGTIRDSLHIITAAHCLPDSDAADVGVVAGLYQRSVPGDSQLRRVAAITSHPGYGLAGEQNDLAVLTLQAPLDMTDLVALEPVPAASDDTWRRAIISGWGTTSSGGSQPDGLRLTGIDVLPDSACGAYGGAYVTSVMLCAGAIADGVVRDTCQGDSGGPLARWDGSGTSIHDFDALVGVVSWGNGCALPGYPGVYTRLANADLNGRAADPSPPARLEPAAGPQVGGTVQAGQTVSCTGDAWTPAATERGVVWLSAALDGDGRPTDVRVEGTAPALALADTLVGRVLTCLVRAANAGGARELQAPVVGPVAARPAGGGGLPGGPSTPATPGRPAGPSGPAAPSGPSGPTGGSTTPPADLVPPTVRFTRRACAARRCDLTFTAMDPGGPAVRATVKVQRLTGCRAGRRGAACRRPRTVAAQRIGAGLFRLRTGRLARARFRFTAVAVDAAGGQSAPVAVTLLVRR